jgi:hypothetical protein
MSYFSFSTLPFWLHSIIELIPSILFVVNPASQLHAPSITSDFMGTVQSMSSAEVMIRQYGVLLLVSVLISAIFALRKVDPTSRQVAASLAVYHLAPIVRATYRLRAGEASWQPDDMGGPWVHLVVHVVLVFVLANLALGGTRDQPETRVPTKSD